MTEYYRHDDVEPRRKVPTVADELAIFGGSGSLIDTVHGFGERMGFEVIVPEPGVDVFQRLFQARSKRILCILQPGDYLEPTFRMPGRWDDLWIYGIPDGSRPRVLGQRVVGNQYGSPGRFMAAVGQQRLLIENVEIAGFSSDTITQGAEADLLLRNCFVHSNGGRALFRGVGCHFSPNLGGTYLIDTELRDAASHTVYLDFGDLSVISGCYLGRQGKNKHAIKNISRRTLVEHNVCESGSFIDSANAWASVYRADGTPGVFEGSPRRYGPATTPYDGMSGTDYAMVRNNRFIMSATGGAMVSLQTRSAANGNFQAYPLPDAEWLGMQRQHLESCDDYIDSDIAPGPGWLDRVRARNYKTGAAPSPMWTDAFWRAFQPRKQYWLANDFELTGDLKPEAPMVGMAVAHGHPVTWSINNGKHLPVSAERLAWLTQQLDNRATLQIIHADNRFPTGLHEDFSWIAGIDQHYGTLPAKDAVIRPLQGEILAPTDVDPMLRRWTAATFLQHEGAPADAPVIKPPSTPATTPEPEQTPAPTAEPEPPVVVITNPPIDPIHEPVPGPEPEPVPMPDWETVGVMSEFSNASEHYRQVLQRMRRVTY